MKRLYSDSALRQTLLRAKVGEMVEVPETCGTCRKALPAGCNTEFQGEPSCALTYGATSARPLSEWHEEDGPVVWWKFPVDEPAWIGTPNCDDWPGYHTHWTPHPAIPAGVNLSELPGRSLWLWTHIVKGGNYRMLGEAKLQTDKPLSDMAEVVIYQGADGRLWAREKHEFEARFSRTRPDAHGVALPDGGRDAG